MRQVTDSLGRCRTRPQSRFGQIEHSRSAFAGLGEIENLRGLVERESGPTVGSLLLQFGDHGFATNLGEFIKRPQHRPAPPAQALRLKKPIEDLAVIERDREVRHARRDRVRRE